MSTKKVSALLRECMSLSEVSRVTGVHPNTLRKLKRCPDCGANTKTVEKILAYFEAVDGVRERISGGGE
jgi:hypothetical protein